MPTENDIKEMREELEKLQNAPQEDVIDGEEAGKQDAEEVIEEKPVDSPEKGEEAVEPVKVPEEPEPDASAYARMRREKRAAEKQAEELRAQIEELKKAKADPQIEEDVNTIELPAEVTELIAERRNAQAEREFRQLEDAFRKSTPHYDDIVDQYHAAMQQSIRIQNPRMPQAEIEKLAKHTAMIKARDYLNKGFDPIEELFNEAVDLGFKPRPAADSDAECKPSKPDLSRINANKERNAGFVGASGNGKGAALTLAAATELTNEQWMKLSPEEKRKLMYGQ